MAKSTSPFRGDCKKTGVSKMSGGHTGGHTGQFWSIPEKVKPSGTRIKKSPPKWGLINLKGQVMKPPHCLK